MIPASKSAAACPSGRSEYRMGRITRYPPKPTPKYLHDVTVLHTEGDQAWIWEEAARLAGAMGYKTRKPCWATTLVAFDTREKADELRRGLRRWRHEQELAKMRRQAERARQEFL